MATVEWAVMGVAGVLIALCGTAQAAAEPPYPFEGVWVRAERACTATTVRERTYTAHEVVSPRGRCAIRRIAGGSSGVFELLEDCRRSDHQGSVTETIKMTTPDAMTLKRQVSRLKIARQIRYARCAASPSPAPAASPRGPRPPGTGIDAKPRERQP